ncbi:Iron-sulfur cluster carrier protein [BD1-7 clade bacterium]|uniref:Iron-sulfur cluster carrier protein n=1 Tax=BD1-7 clade bacterium TaxID=2029982 RepID=A0A5S9PA46_9GAMM|nr:Iron-sulfur cluster carrier protein [BD1-7 clade bacterium]
MSVSTGAVLNVLKTYEDPYFTTQDLVARGAIKHLDIDVNTVKFTVELGYPAATIENQIKADLKALVEGIEGIDHCEITLDWAIVANRTQRDMPSMYRVKNIVAVASGKGGVGKSTTSVNLAIALAQEGARVGLLDADIYGPSQPMMLGIPEETRPEFVDEKHFKPIFEHGIQTMSMGYMVTDKTPMVWRGPMVSGALQQLLTQCMWNDLDYLIVDMPPGTGDIQLTLAQKVPVTGALIVTTPQDIALLDAKKGIEMFRKVDIPVLGMVENMATHICTNCGHEEHIFGEGGGARIAEEYNADLLGSLPLALEIREGTDEGKPTMVKDPDGKIAAIYRDVARRVAGKLAERGQNDSNSPVQMIVTDA